MRLVDEISQSHPREISEAIVFAFARTAVRNALDDAVAATGAHDWGGDTGCFPVSCRTFDEHWRGLREGDTDLPTIAATSILNAVLEGARCETHRLGGAYAPDVLRHVKENTEETVERHWVTIGDDTICHDIWASVCAKVRYHLDRIIPDSIADGWENQA